MEEEIDDKRKKRSTYNKKRYEENKERISLYRKKRYKLLNQKDINVEIQWGEFILTFD